MIHSSSNLVRFAPFAASRAGKAVLLALFSAGAALALSSVAHAGDFKAGAIEIENPWSPSAPNGAKVAGGYFTIVNHGATPDRLVSATAAIAGKAGIHQMTVKNGVMEMREVKGGLEVPASATVKLKPGAYHLMFMDLKHLPKRGESFSGTLTFEKAGTVNVTFDVTGMGGPAMGGAMNPMKSMKHGHDSMMGGSMKAMKPMKGMGN
ncbi:MAG: copper chaperone PCu(A)C [Rhizobiaceae bacterium]|nr:MAG: copper chaperone PCu(A)C [Rhizobiaceae bacterium]